MANACINEKWLELKLSFLNLTNLYIEKGLIQILLLKLSGNLLVF